MRLKKSYLVVLIFAAVMLQFVMSPLMSAFADAERLRDAKSHTALFPDSLLYVADEAFEGTGFQRLVFREGFIHVGERAFSNTRLLVEAYFPKSTEYIADSAFSMSGLEILRGAEGSYIQEWAERHGIAFDREEPWFTAPVDVRLSIALLLSMFGTVCLPMDDDRRIKRYIKTLIISMRPQDRPELNPIDYRFP